MPDDADIRAAMAVDDCSDVDGMLQIVPDGGETDVRMPADPIHTTVTVKALLRIVALACAIIGALAGPGVWVVLAYAGQQWATRAEVAKLETKLDQMAVKQAQMLCLVQYGPGRWDIANDRCRDSEMRTQ